MVRVGAFELHLLVNGVKQAELVGSNETRYIESRFDSPATYKVIKRERDPVRRGVRPGVARDAVHAEGDQSHGRHGVLQGASPC